MFVWLLTVTDDESGDIMRTDVHKTETGAIQAAHKLAKEEGEVIEEDQHETDNEGLKHWHGESDCACYDIDRRELLD